MTPAHQMILQLTLSTVAGTSYAPSSIPLVATFANGGPAPLRLLAVFEPLPVFFSFEIVKADGTPLNLSGAGKIDLGRQAAQYVDLAPGATHRVPIDPGPLVGTPLAPGRYSVTAVYHNQYGENCFQGTARSNTVSLVVAARGGAK